MTWRWPSPGQYEASGFAVRLSARVTGLDRARRVVVATGADGVSQEIALRPPGAGDRLVAVRAADPGADARAASSTAPSRTWRRSATGRAARRQTGVGDRRRSARAGGGQRAAATLGLETHVVEFAPRLMPLQVDETGGAVLRRRIEELGVVVHTGDVDDARSPPATTARVARRCASPTATSWTSTWWCSPPASARATSWRARPGSPSASAAASSSTSGAAPRIPPSSPSASAPRTRGALRPGRARLPDGATSRSRDARPAATSRLHRLRHEHQAEAAGRRRGQLRRRVRRRRPARTSISLLDSSSVGLQEAGRLGRRQAACWAACWSVTPRLRRSSCSWRRTRSSLPAAPRGADPPGAQRRASRPALGVDALPDAAQHLLVQQRHQGRRSAARSATRS